MLNGGLGVSPTRLQPSAAESTPPPTPDAFSGDEGGLGGVQCFLRRLPSRLRRRRAKPRAADIYREAGAPARRHLPGGGGRSPGPPTSTGRRRAKPDADIYREAAGEAQGRRHLPGGGGRSPGPPTSTGRRAFCPDRKCHFQGGTMIDEHLTAIKSRLSDAVIFDL
jgi:hypothetical protein